MIEVYRGSANAWECDEMGHMNVRFYVNRMMEGLAELAHIIGIPAAFSERAASTLRPRDQHIRYIHEARAGEPLFMTAGILATTETAALIYQQLEHPDGRICATFRTWVDHVELASGLAFPWSTATSETLSRLTINEDQALPTRSLSLDIPAATTATMADADAINAARIGSGVIPNTHCDINGFMHAEYYVARVSDSVAHLLSDWRRSLETNLPGDGNDGRIGGAVVEARWVFRHWPRAGDRFVIRTAIEALGESVQTYNHWLVDPTSGQAWATNQTVAIAFDLKERRVHKVPEADQETLKKIAPMGLFI